MKEIKIKHAMLDDSIFRINELTKEFNNSIFFSSFVKNVSFSSFEVCFKDTISWLYILLIEAADFNLKFIVSKINDLGLDGAYNSKEAIKMILALRTSRQHFMNPEKAEDEDKLSYCNSWYRKHCLKDNPESEEDWKKCLNEILDQVLQLFDSIENGISAIKKNDFRDIIKADWQRLKNRSFTKHDWELVLIEVLRDFGMLHYDTMTIVTKELDRWRDKLKILKDGFNFNKEARKIIESYLQSHDLWPASANDLIDLGVPRGPGMGEMIKKAKELYYSDPCPKDELLLRFKVKYL